MFKGFGGEKYHFPNTDKKQYLQMVYLPSKDLPEKFYLPTKTKSICPESAKRVHLSSILCFEPRMYL